MLFTQFQKTQMKDILEYQPRKVDISSTLTALMN